MPDYKNMVGGSSDRAFGNHLRTRRNRSLGTRTWDRPSDAQRIARVRLDRQQSTEGRHRNLSPVGGAVHHSSRRIMFFPTLSSHPKGTHSFLGRFPRGLLRGLFGRLLWRLFRRLAFTTDERIARHGSIAFEKNESGSEKPVIIQILDPESQINRSFCNRLTCRFEAFYH